MDVVEMLFVDNRDHLLTLFAYIDPGTGSLAFQALAATLLSGAVFFQALCRAVVRLVALPFRRLRSAQPEAAGSQKELVLPAANEPDEPQRKAA